jgi:hypothetical protein
MEGNDEHDQTDSPGDRPAHGTIWLLPTMMLNLYAPATNFPS